MKLPDNISTFATWCSFCNAEESSGEVTGMFPFGEGGELVEETLPIGPSCLEKVSERDLLVSLDTADEVG